MEWKNRLDGESVRKLREGLGLRRIEFGAKISYSHEQVQRLEVISGIVW